MQKEDKIIADLSPEEELAKEDYQVVNSKSNRLFIILAGFFIANSLIAEFIGVKIFQFESTIGSEEIWNWELFGIKGSFQFTAGVLLWPIVFIMTDIINEYFGKRGVKFLSTLAAGLIAYSFLAIYGAIQLNAADWWIASGNESGIPDMQAAFSSIFGQGLWIIVGSIAAFFIGQVVDVMVFHRIKQVTGEKYIWLRATGSTLISQFIDSFVVLYIAFVISGSWTYEQWIAIGLINYLYKFLLALILTPILYMVHVIIDKYLGKDLSEKMRISAMKQ